MGLEKYEVGIESNLFGWMGACRAIPHESRGCPARVGVGVGELGQ